MAVQISQASQTLGPSLVDIAPGLVLSAAVAAIAYLAAPLLPRALPIPAMVLALLIGITLNPIAGQPAVWPRLAFSIRTLPRGQSTRGLVSRFARHHPRCSLQTWRVAY